MNNARNSRTTFIESIPGKFVKTGVSWLLLMVIGGCVCRHCRSIVDSAPITCMHFTQTCGDLFVWDSTSNPHLKHDLLCSGFHCWNDIQSSIHGLTLWCFQAAVIPFSIQVLSDPVVVFLVREAVCANLIVHTKNSVSPWTAVRYVWPRPVGSCFDTVADVAMELGAFTELSCFAGMWIVMARSLTIQAVQTMAVLLYWRNARAA